MGSATGWTRFCGCNVVFAVDSGMEAVGDSGEESGDSSVTDGESKVDIVLVGDDSVDTDIREFELRRRERRGSALGPGLPVESVFVWGVSGAWCCQLACGVLLPLTMPVLVPNTDMNDG